MRWLDNITESKDMNLSKLQEILKDREAGHTVVHGVTELDTTERLNNSWFSSDFLQPKTDVFIQKVHCMNNQNPQACCM